MVLNEIGKIADESWNDVPLHYPNVSLDEYIIMPNHIHGIIIIDNNNNAGYENLRPQNINDKDFPFNKTRNENITSNEKELYNIRKYIQRNPLKWELKKTL